jgi:hypothetical protein
MNTDEQRAALHTPSDSVKQGWPCPQISIDELVNRHQPSNTSPKNDHNAELVRSAQAVVDRWEQPSWKDVPATANYIYALRDALAKHTTAKGE